MLKIQLNHTFGRMLSKGSRHLGRDEWGLIYWSIVRRQEPARICKYIRGLCCRKVLTCHSLREASEAEHNQTRQESSEAVSKAALTAQDFSDKITHAFQLATAQGPLCHEPVQGIAVFLEEVTVTDSEGGTTSREQLGRLTGEVIKTVRDSIRQGFLDWSPRILLAMYSCEIQASSKSLFLP